MLDKVKKYFNTVMFLVIIFAICIAPFATDIIVRPDK